MEALSSGSAFFIRLASIATHPSLYSDLVFPSTKNWQNIVLGSTFLGIFGAKYLDLVSPSTKN